MTRTKISAAKLHELLERRYRETAADACLACRVPMPFRVDHATTKSANWRIAAAGECSGMCHTILLDIAEELAGRYDLR